jgi:hypothetical protein
VCGGNEMKMGIQEEETERRRFRYLRQIGLYPYVHEAYNTHCPSTMRDLMLRSIDVSPDGLWTMKA